MKSKYKNLIIWFVIIAIFIYILYYVYKVRGYDFSQLYDKLGWKLHSESTDTSITEGQPY